MKIVIIGGGKVGFAIAREMSGEGHDITIIDHNRDSVESLSVALDCMVIQGDGNSLEAQRAANVGESDLMIAAMLDIEVTGITGTMTWDESGAVTKTPLAATIVNGEYVVE